jgi:hypothetical protein
MPPPRTLARIAGLLYLLVALLGGFAIAVRAAVVVPGDAAATADSIRASATLFRLGFVSDLVANTCFLLTAMALYLLFKHVNQLVAAAMVTLLAVSAAIGALNLLNQYTALTIATDDAYTDSFGKAGADALTFLFVDMRNNGYTLNAMFYGLWLLPLGYLVIRSGYFPKVLGLLLIIGGLGYLTLMFTTFLAPDAGVGTESVLGAISGIPELLLMAWLLIMGVRVPAEAALKGGES